MKTTYTTVTGHTIEYEASTKVAAFLRKIEACIDDPAVSEIEAIGYAYSSENPILDHSLFPGRGPVTKAVLDDPAYQVMTDLLFRKHVAELRVDLNAISAQFTMTPAEAAEELGVHESAIRQAIKARRIPSWKRDGKHYLNPADVRSLVTGSRGPKAGAKRRKKVSDGKQ